MATRISGRLIESADRVFVTKTRNLTGFLGDLSEYGLFSTTVVSSETLSAV